MSEYIIGEIAAASVPNAPTGKFTLFLDTDGIWKKKNDAGVVTLVSGASGNDELVAVSNSDTTPGFLGSKLLTSSDISINLNNPFGDENLDLTLIKTDVQSFSFTRNNNDFVQENSLTYVSVSKITYVGTDRLRTPTNIIANVWNDGGTSVSVRVTDITNANVIAELTGITSSSDINIEDLGALSNLPNSPALFLVELLQIGGGMADNAKISSLTIY